MVTINWSALYALVIISGLSGAILWAIRKKCRREGITYDNITYPTEQFGDGEPTLATTFKSSGDKGTDERQLSVQDEPVEKSRSDNRGVETDSKAVESDRTTVSDIESEETIEPL